ncbi:hypothetical protein BpHYR1_038600 [Brachionus plicatilis]|uniref:Uncharacterized protein n=1 Tax=Brachionus plicatilis TaxID=10195 RepID=A0A3M7PRH4_BRAPC|nr:hypothetical protein BpHYR1_038600 [Brachionus plicatilis]
MTNLENENVNLMAIIRNISSHPVVTAPYDILSSNLTLVLFKLNSLLFQSKISIFTIFIFMRIQTNILNHSDVTWGLLLNYIKLKDKNTL